MVTVRWALLIAVLTVVAVDPAAVATEAGDEVVILEERPGDGVQCLVCRQAVHGEPVVEARYKGRRFHVRVDMLDEFRSDPERYFRSLEARSGLFDEVAVPEKEARGGYGWFAFGLYVLVGLVFAAACGGLAVNRGRPAWAWFFAGLFFNLPALIVLLIRSRGEAAAVPAGVPGGLRKVPTTRAPIACPSCGSEIHPAARCCNRCGAALAPLVEAETEKV